MKISQFSLRAMFGLTAVAAIGTYVALAVFRAHEAAIVIEADVAGTEVYYGSHYLGITPARLPLRLIADERMSVKDVVNGWRAKYVPYFGMQLTRGKPDQQIWFRAPESERSRFFESPTPYGWSTTVLGGGGGGDRLSASLWERTVPRAFEVTVGGWTDTAEGTIIELDLRNIQRDTIAFSDTGCVVVCVVKMGEPVGKSKLTRIDVRARILETNEVLTVKLNELRLERDVSATFALVTIAKFTLPGRVKPVDQELVFVELRNHSRKPANQSNPRSD